MSDSFLFVRHSELVDGREFTGPTLRPDGTIGIYIRGRGLSCGPLSPDQLRAFAHQALGIADTIEAGAHEAASQASAELERIVGGGYAH